MKTAVYRDLGVIEIEERALPVPAAGQALVRVRKSGICGTDIKTFKRGHPLFTPPCVLGHEFTGEVVAVGAGMTDSYCGKKFVFAPYLECGECETCREGLPQFCNHKVWIDGALSEYVLVPRLIMERGVAGIPAGIDECAVTLTEPLACAVHGIERSGAVAGDQALVMGAGIMGLLIAVYLKNMGCKTWISEVDDGRLAVAASLGLSTIDARSVDYAAFTKANGKFKRVILANDKGLLVPGILPYISPGGCLELFGGMPKDMRIELDPYYVHYKEIDVAGSFGFAAPHFHKAAAMIFANPESFAKLVTCKYPLEQTAAAFGAAMNPANYKVVVEI